MDERTARQLKLILDHELDLALRSFDQERNRLYASLGATGMFFSGNRLRLMVSAMETSVFNYLSKALATALSKSAERDAFNLAADSTQRLYDAFLEMLPKIVWHPTGLPNVRGAASQSAYDATKKLLEQVWSDFQAKLVIAEFDFDDCGLALLQAETTREPANQAGRPNIVLVPEGFLKLQSVAAELETSALDEPMECVAQGGHVDFGGQYGSSTWRVNQQRSTYLLLQKCVCQDPQMPHIEVWTRHGPGATLELIAPTSLAVSRSIDWCGIFETGLLIVLTDPDLKPIDRWPLFVRKDQWLKAKPMLMKMLAPSRFAKPRLSDGQLISWWKQLPKEQRELPQRGLEALVRTAFPDHQISRERIRELAVKRAVGRPTLRHKKLAQKRRI